MPAHLLDKHFSLCWSLKPEASKCGRWRGILVSSEELEERLLKAIGAG